MSRFRKLSQAIWHCHYHIVWCPKYRFRILKGEIRKEVTKCIEIFSQRLGCEIKELNVQDDHVHILYAQHGHSRTGESPVQALRGGNW